MTDFVVIVPSGWTEMPTIADLINTGAEPVEAMTFKIAQQAWGDIETLLASAGVLPENKTVTNAKLVLTETGYRFWVVYN